MPRTPDGKPDLQGVYSNAQTIPVARPAYLGAKEFYTDEADKEASAKAAPAAAGGEDVEALPRPPITTAGSPFTTTTASSVSAEPSIQRAASLRTSIISAVPQAGCPH